MIRRSIFALQTIPDGETLRQFSTRYGFTLFYEKNSDLYFLNNTSEADPKTPEFGGFYESVLKRSENPGNGLVKAEIRELIKQKKLSRYQFNMELLSDALFFSRVFKTRIFCAYHDDEDTDIAIIAENGTLIQLNLSGTLNETGTYEIRKTGRSKATAAFVEEFDGFDSLYRQTFEFAFGQDAPDLMFFGQPKPKGQALKAEAKLFDTSQAALLRSYGHFKIIDKQDAEISVFRRQFHQKLEIVLKIVLLPFFLIGFFIWEALYRRKNNDRS